VFLIIDGSGQRSTKFELLVICWLSIYRFDIPCSQGKLTYGLSYSDLSARFALTCVLPVECFSSSFSIEVY
jgi:hypothetical protein